MSHIGSATGTGNPPGKHTEAYLTEAEYGAKGDFTTKDGYQMATIKRSATVVGNQPKENKTSTIESFQKKNSI